MTRLFLLDTNAASDVMNGYSLAARQTLIREARSSVIAISSITLAELGYGIQKKKSSRLQKAFDGFRREAAILAWDEAAAEAYASLRDTLTRRGITLAEMDLLIASHALALDAVLVSRDKAFEQVGSLIKLVNWSTDLK